MSIFKFATTESSQSPSFSTRMKNIDIYSLDIEEFQPEYTIDGEHPYHGRFGFDIEKVPVFLKEFYEKKKEMIEKSPIEVRASESVLFFLTQTIVSTTIETDGTKKPTTTTKKVAYCPLVATGTYNGRPIVVVELRNVNVERKVKEERVASAPMNELKKLLALLGK